MSFLAGNLAVLKKRYPKLYGKVSSAPVSKGRLEVLDARNKSGRTVRVSVTEYGREKKLFINSSFDPEREGSKFASEQMREQKRVNFLYGFGLGYHVQEMARLLAPENKLTVFDMNLDVFYQAIKLRDLTDIFENPEVELFISDDLYFMADKIGTFLKNNPDLHFVFHGPSLTATDEKYVDLKFLLQEINLRKSITPEYRVLLHSNFLKNRQLIKRNIGEFFGRFRDIPIIIVSAGPSLDKNKCLLQGLEDKALIISVAHALRALMRINVKPHFIITIDPQPVTLKQIEGYEGLNIPFILMATAYCENAEIYRGPKFMACQHRDYLLPGEEDHLIETGGSVSTTALDIAIRMGGSPIIYLGQDLAFTSDRHHCEDSFHQSVDIKPLDTMRKVQGWNNTQVSTTLGMLSFKRWIQSRVRDERAITFINSTEGGALIEGFSHIPFAEAIRKFINKKYQINKIIDEVMQDS